MRNDPVIKGSYFARQDIPIKGELSKARKYQISCDYICFLTLPRDLEGKALAL